MRDNSLDGLRGIAALLVVFSHLVVAFQPALYFGREALLENNALTFLATSPFFVFVNGSFAVYVFFRSERIRHSLVS
ncbi:acyltransferase family protein [Salinarimonas soli]|uniref:Acyltransferase family protein n=1 Tax=Salinarimonas soli TaxID=1638099 RepID=A0A5B2V979_9HYPH|nr:acyltransferase family protein [Salinarimonas soli]KAA2235258.1 acyltransferase family protein [Salinarimonas soli]